MRYSDRVVQVYCARGLHGDWPTLVPPRPRLPHASWFFEAWAPRPPRDFSSQSASERHHTFPARPMRQLISSPAKPEWRRRQYPRKPRPIVFDKSRRQACRNEPRVISRNPPPKPHQNGNPGRKSSLSPYSARAYK